MWDEDVVHVIDEELLEPVRRDINGRGNARKSEAPAVTDTSMVERFLRRRFAMVLFDLAWSWWDCSPQERPAHNIPYVPHKKFNYPNRWNARLKHHRGARNIEPQTIGNKENHAAFRKIEAG